MSEASEREADAVASSEVDATAGAAAGGAAAVVAAEGKTATAADADSGKREEGDAAQTALIDVDDLCLAINKVPILHNISFKLKAGDRCLVLGSNGAGKSTLLRVLAGRHFYSRDTAARIKGRSCYFDSSLNKERSFLTSSWGKRTVAFSGFGQYHQADVPVSEVMGVFQKRYPKRRDLIKDVLEIDLGWRLHAVSEGQRRKVQIMVQLLQPTSVVLMDEVTTGLDVVSRSNFLNFMKAESERRGVCCMYATHIFDGLRDWATHIMYLNDGRVTRFGRIEEFSELQDLVARGVTSPLYRLVETWMRADKEAAEERLETRPVAALADPTSMAAGLGNGFAAGRLVRKMYPME